MIAGKVTAKAHEFVELGSAMAEKFVDGKRDEEGTYDWPGEEHIPEGTNDELVLLVRALFLALEKWGLRTLHGKGWIGDAALTKALGRLS